MKIEKAKEKDAEEILKYFRENDGNFEKGDKNCERFIRNRIEYFLKNNLITLVRDDGKIGGHLFADIKENPNLGVVELETITLREEYRGKGIGTMLLKESLELIKKHLKDKGITSRCAYALTRSNNLAAISMYENAGFKKQNTIGKIYREDQPEELVMTRFF